MPDEQMPLETETKLPTRRYADLFMGLRHEMDDLIDRFFVTKRFSPFRFPGLTALAAPVRGDGEMILPQVDIYDEDKAFELTAELPGISEDDIEMSVKDGVLSLWGEKKYEKSEETENAQIIERRYGKFSRSFTLPASVDPDKIVARFKDGILSVTLPKLPEKQVKEHKIKIKS